MRIHNFAFDKQMLNVVFISLGIHIFYFSCIVFTFQDKISYPMEPPSIDFLGSILRKSDLSAGSKIAKNYSSVDLSDKFFVNPAQKADAEISYAAVRKPPVAKAGLPIGGKLSSKFIGVASNYRIENKSAIEESGATSIPSSWGDNLRLKADDKN
ncbi:MAG: hypothetical protein PHI86_03070 [Candidatus Omnitrophica bacterium]|nr:hypothetical protein [Candidatus Omnitrophota bacterium]HOX54957.1 hypothetical protein [Candidatus Omnitrophota bacterium]